MGQMVSYDPTAGVRGRVDTSAWLIDEEILGKRVKVGIGSVRVVMIMNDELRSCGKKRIIKKKYRTSL